MTVVFEAMTDLVVFGTLALAGLAAELQIWREGRRGASGVARGPAG